MEMEPNVTRLGIGIIFAIINQYVGLKVGMIVSGSGTLPTCLQWH